MSLGHSSAVVRALSESRAIAKLVFSDLQLDSSLLAQWLHDSQVVTRALYAWARDEPGVLDAVAERIPFGPDYQLGTEMRSAQRDFDAARRVKEQAVP